MKRVPWLVGIGLALVGLVVVVDRLAGPEGGATTGQTREERVATKFQGWAGLIAEKERLPAVPAAAHLPAGEDRLSSGAVVSLWVTDPAVSQRSRCYYLDVDDPSGPWGSGGCGGGEDEQVTLNGGSETLVGAVGSWPAAAVRLTAGESFGQLTARVPVVGGFFLVPPALAVHAGAEGGLSVDLLGPAGQLVAVVSGLAAPGAAVPAIVASPGG